MTADELVKLYGMQPHPEGGYYKETHRAAGKIKELDRNFSTAIYYLLPKGTRSRLHRLKWDELFHFYLGGPLVLVKISPNGRVEIVRLGHDVGSGCQLQHVITAGTWFGAYPEDESDFCLIGCTVAPGFDFADFEIGDKARLLAQFPQAKDLIVKLMP
ncbi:MAG: cupin domain-containing protein [Elusimicrobia bacterium]|nr:cupin domain-containing protein [Elusimicrobiota bacterium]